MDLTWDWPCGVAYYGITRAYQATGKEEYINHLIQWTDEYIQLGLPLFTVNTCAMGHCLITLYEQTGDRKYWDIVMDKIDYLQHKALRFGDGVLQHTVSEKDDFPQQCWADTLFMAAYFMLRVGKQLQDPSLTNDALHQFQRHIEYLQNKETGLWYHAYTHVEKNHLSGFYWGRANAWAAYTMSRVKDHLDQWYLYPPAMDIECSLRDQLAAIKVLQTEKGLYRTLLDDVDSYEEVSASAGIAAAMVHNANPLHRKYIGKTAQGLLHNITSDGRVLNVSGGTAVMKDQQGYRDIPKNWIQGWGQGLAL
ncbi:MAG: glycoside hydrolase 105 family protein, partial [Clostridiales bacterium]|nr:glycoside hydrolase 105 family protein [Clostridiales bacterium]